MNKWATGGNANTMILPKSSIITHIHFSAVLRVIEEGQIKHSSQSGKSKIQSKKRRRHDTGHIKVCYSPHLNKLMNRPVKIYINTKK